MSYAAKTGATAIVHRFGAAWVATFLVASCAVGPNYHRPDPHLPAQFAVGSTVPGNTGPTQAGDKAAAVDYATWWHGFHDAELESLIDRAIKANPDIQIALDHLQAARTFEIAIVGAALPDAEASAGVGRGTGSDLTRGRAAQNLRSADTTTGLQHINVLAGFDTTWELDIFGKFRREIQAARADYQATVAQRNAVLVSVIADVARAYVDLRGLQMQAAVLHSAAGVLQESARIANERYQRGITNELDVTLANRELAVLQSKMAPVDSEVSAAEYTLATLLGRYPEDLVAELQPAAMVPPAPAVVQTGLPLDLVRRRPDIVQAERELAGATARIGVATANLFPSIGVTAAIGYQRQGLGSSPVLGKHIWSAGAGAVWPLLDFGALDAQVQIADLRTRALLVSYRRTIQDAVRDVDTSWTHYGAQQERVGKLGDAMLASQSAVTLANERYERGLTDFLNVVDAQRQEYDIEEQYAEAQVNADEQFIALYRSLGGGWENYQDLPPPYFPKPAIVAEFRRVLNPDDPLK
jgi:NodT family efflux transporter outer membrane factor (OMF) lipoprotein